jgi:hypothetical protein
MKTTRKIGVVTALLLSLAVASQAQTQPQPSPSSSSDKFRLSVGPEAGLPVGSFHDAYGSYFGGSVQGELPVVKNLSVILNAGYNDFIVKDGVPLKNLSTLPIKAGLRYYFLPDLLYVQGEAGTSILLNKNDVLADKSADFAYAGSVGVLIPLAKKNYLDVGVRWQGQSSYYDNGSAANFLGLRVAYTLGF